MQCCSSKRSVLYRALLRAGNKVVFHWGHSSQELFILVQSRVDWRIIKGIMLAIINVLIRSHIGVIHPKCLTALIIMSNVDLVPTEHSKRRSSRAIPLPFFFSWSIKVIGICRKRRLKRLILMKEPKEVIVQCHS